MGLYKRGSVWWMSFIYQGKQIRRSTETEDKTLAKRILDKVKGEVAEGKWFEKLPGEDKTFAEMIEKYMVEHSARNKAPSSYERDKGLKKHLDNFFGNLPLIDITPSLIAEYKTYRREQGISARTLNYELALMSHAFNLAIKEWEWVSDNPVKKISREKVNNQIDRWLTLEEEERLLDASPDWLQEIISFAVNTGLRQNEILDLELSRVDLTRKTITILEQKNKGRDTLPLNRRSFEILEKKVKEGNGQPDLVFHNQVGQKIDDGNLRRAFYSAVRKAKIKKLRFHDLRHTFATRLVQAGVDLYTVQKLGQWKNVSMVMRYAHHYPESLRPGVEVLDQFGQKLSQIYHSSKKKELQVICNSMN